jgi:hypothetical protein
MLDNRHHRKNHRLVAYWLLKSRQIPTIIYFSQWPPDIAAYPWEINHNFHALMYACNRHMAKSREVYSYYIPIEYVLYINYIMLPRASIHPKKWGDGLQIRKLRRYATRNFFKFWYTEMAFPAFWRHL